VIEAALLRLIVLRQELRHRAAITLGHAGVLTAGIFPLLDGNRLVETLPQPAELYLLIAGQRRTKGIRRQNAGVAIGIDQHLTVGAVIDKKGFIGIPVAEMTPQQRKNAVFGLNFRAQHTAVIRKSHKSAQLFQLTAHVPQRFGYRIIHRIGRITEKNGALVV